MGLQRRKCLREVVEKDFREEATYNLGIKKMIPFRNFGRSGRKGRGKSNLIRGNRMCKGTRSVTAGKGEMIREHREYRVHEKHEERQEKKLFGNR